MWTYYQTGLLVGPDERQYSAYSGRGEYKNRPDAQYIQDWGPIPCGVYRIGDPTDTLTHGPYVLPLTPDAANKMFGRAGFLIHGDSIVEPGTASEGCIIVAKMVRETIHLSQDRELHVVSGSEMTMVAIDPGTESE